MAFHRDPKHNTQVNKKYSQSIIGVNMYDLTEDLGDIRVVHVGAGLQDLLTLVLGPDHEGVHGSLDVRVPVTLTLGLPNNFISIPFSVFFFFLFHLHLLTLTIFRWWWGILRGECREWLLGMMMRAYRVGEPPGSVLDKVHVRKLRERTPRKILQKSWMTEIGWEAKRRMHHVSWCRWHWGRRNQIRKLGLVKHVHWGVRAGEKRHVIVVSLGAGASAGSRSKKMFGFWEIQRGVIVKPLCLGWRRSRGPGSLSPRRLKRTVCILCIYSPFLGRCVGLFLRKCLPFVRGHRARPGWSQTQRTGPGWRGWTPGSPPSPCWCRPWSARRSRAHSPCLSSLFDGCSCTQSKSFPSFYHPHWHSDSASLGRI